MTTTQETWMSKLQDIVTAVYEVRVMAGHVRSFATWCDAVIQTRDILRDATNSATCVDTTVYHGCKLYEFRGTVNGLPFSLNVPFPREF